MANVLRKQPAGTLVFWDGETGPSWHGLKPEDFEAAGYERLRSQSYSLDGYLHESEWRWTGKFGARPQEMHLLYKAY